MEITKSSELREGMRVKFKYKGISFWGWARQNEEEEWYCVGGTGTGLLITDWKKPYFCEDITDVESYEGLRAAKEGDVLVNESGGEAMVFLSNDFGAITSYADEFKSAAEFDTWEELEEYGYKLKDQEQPSESPAIITSNELEIQRKVFTEIEDELLKHKFTTDMSGWEIVPQLMATMQILRHKYFKENQGA